MRKIYPNEQLAIALMEQHPDIEENRSRTALDAGCGFGRHTKLLKERGYGRVVAIDVDEERLDITRGLLERSGLDDGVDLLRTDLLEYSQEEGFDVVVAWNYIYAYNRTYDECEKRIRHIYGLLKKGGKVFFNFRSEDDIIYKLHHETAEKVFRYDRYGVDGYVFFTQRELAEVLTRCGLKILSLENEIVAQSFERGSGMENSAWGRVKLDQYDSWYNVTAVKEN